MVIQVLEFCQKQLDFWFCTRELKILAIRWDSGKWVSTYKEMEMKLDKRHKYDNVVLFVSCLCPFVLSTSLALLMRLDGWMQLQLFLVCFLQHLNPQSSQEILSPGLKYLYITILQLYFLSQSLSHCGRCNLPFREDLWALQANESSWHAFMLQPAVLSSAVVRF